MGKTVLTFRKHSDAVGVAASDYSGTSAISLARVRRNDPARPSVRTALVQLRFGVPPGGQCISLAENTSIRLGPGRLVLLVGPSGSGKSSAVSAIESHFASPPPLINRISTVAEGDKGGCLNVQRVDFTEGCALIDEVAPHGDLAEAGSILTACGLGEAGLWLRPFATLSEGEKFRARLARAISLQADRSAHLDSLPVTPLLCDEFCSGLHRRAAKAIAHNLRKLATRRGLCVVIACSSDDLTADLDPNCLVQFTTSRRGEAGERSPRANAVLSLRRKLRIEPGAKRDYDQFAKMHYRETDELGFVDRVFVLREGAGGEALGIVVYSHPALELSLRNKATNGWFSRNPQRVNDHLRVVRRLIIHPDVRGCGLGHYLVRNTMPLLGTQYVECLAAMGEFNPVFERAGMVRVGQYDVPTGPRTALESLRAMDVDPQSTDFTVTIARHPAVRAAVVRAISDWYSATTAGGERRALRQSPEVLARTFRGLIGMRPVYYLWRRGETSTLKNSKFPNEPICQS